jgi:hypothetical protein
LPEAAARRLLTRRGRDATVRGAICEECVIELSRELRSGAALDKTDALEPLPLQESAIQVPAPAELCGWQKFRLEGKKLEWRAERTVVQTARPAVLVHVRSPKAGRQITLTMHPGSTPTRDDAESAGQWLLSPPAEDPELRDGPEAFGPLGSMVTWRPMKVEGQLLEWSAERAYVYEATPYVQIEVREYRTSNRATTYLDYRTVPSLSHAITTAREL